MKELRDERVSELDNDSAEASQMGKISGFEYKFILLIALALCVATSAPYVFGHFARFPGSVFTGILAFDGDAYNYLSYARQAADGAWLFHNPMTGEPHGDVFFNLEWLFVGKIASLLHLSVGSAMNLTRPLFIPILCFAVYWLATFLLRDVFLRRTALVAVMLDGGFGWYLLTLNLLHISAEQSYFWDLRAGLFPYFWALKAPHHLVAGTLATLSICTFLRAEHRPQLGSYGLAGLFFLLTGACRPYDMVYLLVAASLYWVVALWRSGGLDRQAWLRALPMVVCIPLLGYYYWIFRIHPVFRWWSLPGQDPPAPWILAFSFGLAPALLLLSAWKIVWAWKLGAQRLSDASIFVICCLMTACGLVYLHGLLPFTFQFVTAILVPLVMVVFLGLERPFIRWNLKSRWARVSVVALVSVNSLTAVGLTAQATRLAWRGNYRVDRSLIESYLWLNDHTRPNELVLANVFDANRIPEYAHNLVFCGYMSAVRYEEKMKDLDMFFAANSTNEWREKLIKQNEIRYVLVTREEARQIPSLADAQFLHRVFANDAAVIYESAPR